MDEGTLRVLVVDDHPGVRLGIANLVQGEHPRMQAVAAVGTAEEALAETALLQPHVVVLDVNLGHADGLALIPALRRLAPCRVVVITSSSEPRIPRRAQEMGAAACVHKTSPAHELLAHIGMPAPDLGAVHPLLAGSAMSWPADDQAPGLTGRT